jgi:hypothetical protein
MTYKSILSWYKGLVNGEVNMSESKPKLPTRGAVQKLRELYQKNRENAKASKELLEILNPEKSGSPRDKKVALPERNLESET